MWRPLTFLVGTVALLVVSQQALKKPRSHGFYRFFAWELMLALFLLNVPRWFADVLAWHQIISWFLLLICLIPLFYGVSGLAARGKPDASRRPEPELLAFEHTTQLVTDGIYRYIRHPLYSSLLLLDWGMFFKLPSWMGFALALGASLLLVAIARADEAECMDCFGTQYRLYMQNTRMFIPYIF